MANCRMRFIKNSSDFWYASEVVYTRNSANPRYIVLLLSVVVVVLLELVLHRRRLRVSTTTNAHDCGGNGSRHLLQLLLVVLVLRVTHTVHVHVLLQQSVDGGDRARFLLRLIVITPDHRHLLLQALPLLPADIVTLSQHVQLVLSTHHASHQRPQILVLLLKHLVRVLQLRHFPRCPLLVLLHAADLKLPIRQQGIASRAVNLRFRTPSSPRPSWIGEAVAGIVALECGCSPLTPSFT